MEDMEIKEMLNGDKAEELFNSEAVLLDDCGAIPATRAEELLGVDAVACVKFYANKQGGKDELERLFLCLTKKQKQIVVLSVILSACAGKAIHEQS